MTSIWRRSHNPQHSRFRFWAARWVYNAKKETVQTRAPHTHAQSCLQSAANILYACIFGIYRNCQHSRFFRSNWKRQDNLRLISLLEIKEGNFFPALFQTRSSKGQKDFSLTLISLRIQSFIFPGSRNTTRCQIEISKMAGTSTPT